MSKRVRIVTPVLLASLVMVGLAGSADAQPMGTFRWQQQPYCNVVTLSVTRTEDVFQLDGFDDQCGAGTRASAVGIAFFNPDGSIGMGLTIVATPGGTPLHLDATIGLASLSGIWRDSTGATGAWPFLPGAGAGGTPRPAPRAAFPGGIALSGATIAAVGSPVNPSDAATKAYADAGTTAAASYARSLATAPLVLTAYGARTALGTTTTEGFGCIGFATATETRVMIDLPLPAGASITALQLKYRDQSTSAMTFVLRNVHFSSVGSDSGPASTTSLDGSLVVQTFSFTPPPPVSAERFYYLWVEAPAHTNMLSFCGVQVIYSMP